MKANIIDIVTAAFDKKGILSKEELMEELRAIFPDVAEETLSWRVHDLKSKGILNSPGRGLYRGGRQIKAFQPTVGNVTRRIAALITKELPLVKYCVWETRWLSNWMQLQPAANWIIVEVEKAVLTSVFTRLTRISNKVFLDPGWSVVDLYILPLNDAVIVKPLLSEAPVLSVGKINTATPEKILADIVSEPYLFRAQQGELDGIFANAFKDMVINQTKMLRYARRRGKEEKVLDLIQDEFRLPETLSSV